MSELLVTAMCMVTRFAFSAVVDRPVMGSQTAKPARRRGLTAASAGRVSNPARVAAVAAEPSMSVLRVILCGSVMTRTLDGQGVVGSGPDSQRPLPDVRQEVLPGSLGTKGREPSQLVT